MVNLDNLGYNTYVLGTIRAVTESEKIIVFDRNVFMNDPNSGYSRINLYNLTDIYYSTLYNINLRSFDSRCLVLKRDLKDVDDQSEVPFEYTCSNPVTNGFNMIIYLDHGNNPTGYTEFLNTQGRISDYIRIYLKFNIEINRITLELSNSLYKIQNRLEKNFIGTELNKFPSSTRVVSEINKLPKDQLYTSHLSNFLRLTNNSNVILGDRVLLSSGNIKKLEFLRGIDILGGEEYSNHQVGYYQNDVVLYSWIFLQDSVGYYYRITSLIDQRDYKYTRQTATGEYIDTIKPYDQEREKSKDLLYCAGKYLVFMIFYESSNFLALYDTSNDSWVESREPNTFSDSLDRRTRIYELPKPTLIQSYQTAIELIPELSDTFIDLEDFIQTRQRLEVIGKHGDWFVIKDQDLYLFSCPSISVWMTYDEYRNCIVINNNTLLLKDSDYYIIYHGPQRKIYYTEKAKCILLNQTLQDFRLGDRTIKACDSEYLEAYKKSEVAIVYKNSMIYDGFLDSYRHQALSTSYTVPHNIIGALGSVIFYLDQNNNINYI